ncbi:hypothetical protein TERTU_0376 [Teredinibacter turnerae T7901]|uniref:Uncharacterized protein n=1 Tax=Teredinibacter turnerae (strain ATCC 39867 / T7901) TaxID=377629 RepID=C5BMB2_TERTT|nr:hypothetical protein TERTU_0376 [Teredinibacter turnerae T7901]
MRTPSGGENWLRRIPDSRSDYARGNTSGYVGIMLAELTV